jgi:transposase
VDTLRVWSGELRRGSPDAATETAERREFWANAVALTRQPGNTVTSIARDLEVSYEGLRLYQADIDAGVTAGLTSDERAELVRLRRENRTLRMEREILKEAAVFFATETDETR